VAGCSHCSHYWRPPPDAGRRAQGSAAAHGGHAHLFVFVSLTIFPHGRRGRHCCSMRPPLRRQPSYGVEDGRVAVHARASLSPSPRTAALLACTAASRLCTACLDGAAPDALREYPRTSGLGAEHPIETPYFRPHGCEVVGQSDGTSFRGRKKKRRSTGTKVACTKLYGQCAPGDAHHAGAAAEGGRVDWSGGAGWCHRAGDSRQF